MPGIYAAGDLATPLMPSVHWTSYTLKTRAWGARERRYLGVLVEAAGIEPASVDPPQSGLHA